MKALSSTLVIVCTASHRIFIFIFRGLFKINVCIFHFQSCYISGLSLLVTYSRYLWIFLLSVIKILKRKEKDKREYLYVSANIEGKTTLPFGGNFRNAFRKRSMCIRWVSFYPRLIILVFFIINAIYAPLKKSAIRNYKIQIPLLFPTPYFLGVTTLNDLV